MYERLLLANDGSELAEAALPRAAALARAMGSEVLVLRVSHSAGASVEELTPDSWGRHIALAGAEAPGEARAEAYPPLTLTVAALQAAGIAAVGSLVLRGDPGEVIAEAASRLGCDAIVMSSHGLSGIRRAVLGSVSDHVIRHSRGIPVLLYRPIAGTTDAADEGTYQRILVALDGSELAGALIPHAQEIASRTGAEVVLLRVVDSVTRVITMTTPAGYPMPGDLTVEIAEDTVRVQRASATEQLEAIAGRLREAGISSVRALIAEGEPGLEIVAAAEELDCDLVLLATHGRGGLGRALLGSVTDHVTRHLSSAAALIVPHGS